MYWCARVALVVAWLAVAWMSRTSGGRRGGRWRLGITAGLLFASMRAWPWNYVLLETARSMLSSLGAYDDRFWGKLVLAVGVLGVTIFIVATARWRGLRASTIACRVGVGCQALLIAVETFSLDDALPHWCFEQPWRYAGEGAFAGLALLGLGKEQVRGGGP